MLDERRTNIVRGCIEGRECLSVLTQVVVPLRPGLNVVVNACAKYAHPRKLFWNRTGGTPNCKTTGKEGD